MNQCGNCGAGLRPDSVRCVKCGSVLPAAPPPVPVVQPAQPAPAVALALPREPRSPFLAFVMSLIVAGLGQVYNGSIVKAVLFFLAATLTWCALLGWIVHIAAAIEAAHSASKRNRGLNP